MKTYKEFINVLKANQDLKYRDFHKKLTFTKYEIIGIRAPVLRSIAKEIVKDDYKSFLNSVKSTYYEEVFIEGLVIASLPEEKLFNYLPKFISKIDNWAICDSFCSSLKIVKNDYPKYFSYFKSYINSGEEFKVRVALVVFLNFYIKEEYLKELFDLIDSITLDKYYVDMAIAWLLTEMFIKYPKETEIYLSITKINDFTFNKTISKICDSYRISREEKEKLKKLRRQI